LSLFKIFKITTCFGLYWPSSSVNNCSIRKLLLFYSVMLVRPFAFSVPVPRCFLACLRLYFSYKTIINTWIWPIQAETSSDFEDFKKWQVLRSVLNVDRLHKDGKRKLKWNNDVQQDANVQYYELYIISPMYTETIFWDDTVLHKAQNFSLHLCLYFVNNMRHYHRLQSYTQKQIPCIQIISLYFKQYKQNNFILPQIKKIMW
jgi:hypothetical protein